MEKKIELKDITKVATKISDMYHGGKKDAEISKAIGLPEHHVLGVRRMLGLLWTRRTSVFSNLRKLTYDDSTEKFVLSSAQIPFEIAEQLGLKASNSYEYMAFVEKKGVIRIEISQRVE